MLSACSHGGYKSGRSPHGFHQDRFGDFRTEGQARIADHADDIGLCRKQSHDLIFTKSHLAQPIRYLRRSAELFDAHGHAGLNAVQGTPRICAVLSYRGFQRAFVRHAQTLTSEAKTGLSYFVIGWPSFEALLFAPEQEMVSLWQPS